MMICYRSCVGCCRNYRQSAKGRAGQRHTTPYVTRVQSSPPHPFRNNRYLPHYWRRSGKTQCLNVRQRETAGQVGMSFGRGYIVHLHHSLRGCVLRCCATTVRMMQARAGMFRQGRLAMPPRRFSHMRERTVPSTQGFSPT